MTEERATAFVDALIAAVNAKKEHDACDADHWEAADFWKARFDKHRNAAIELLANEDDDD